MVFGLPSGTDLEDALATPDAWRWPPFVVALVTIGVMVIAPRITRALPAAVFALLAGVGAYFALSSIVPALLELDGNGFVIGPVAAEGSLWSSITAQLAGITPFPNVADAPLARDEIHAEL